jgi:hypothetical protein
MRIQHGITSINLKSIIQRIHETETQIGLKTNQTHESTKFLAQLLNLLNEIPLIPR